MVSMVDLSIIIVNYKLKELLEECLLSIREHGGNGYTLEIFVVDNNSRDGTLEMLKSEFPEVKVIALPENKGFAVASNAAIRNSTGKHILLLNNDTRVLENTLGSIIKFMNHYENVGCVGCRHYGKGNKPQLTWGKFPSFWSELHRKSINFFLKWGGTLYRSAFKLKYSGVLEVDWVSGSCMAVKREVIERIGLLDENILIYFEDIDWCTKICRAGWKVVHHSNIPVFHHGGASAKKFSGLSDYQYRVSQLYFWNKYYPSQRVWFLRALIVIRGITNCLKAILRKMFPRFSEMEETPEEQIQYSKDTILLGWGTGKPGQT